MIDKNKCFRLVFFYRNVGICLMEVIGTSCFTSIVCVCMCVPIKCSYITNNKLLSTEKKNPTRKNFRCFWKFSNSVYSNFSVRNYSKFQQIFINHTKGKICSRYTFFFAIQSKQETNIFLSCNLLPTKIKLIVCCCYCEELTLIFINFMIL